ncbi:MAG: beta-hydroxydecanoyl-ACP dehydratase, partial [Flavobacteriaceae bacterium]|nr:beta-hydroxydecanoyl-ACP dehydratase [Flavobacteriaceae bacterium]
ALKAEKMVKKPSSITTEYDIVEDNWCLIDGQIPWAVAVEAGQCDLLLISYLGIDFSCKGERVYRLVDCTLTFLDEMPKVGDVLRYEIKIKSFAKFGETEIFFFSYECFVKDKKVFTMTNGCAGFYNQKELDEGKGVIRSGIEKAERAKIIKQNFTPLLNCQKTSFNKEELLSISEGNIENCFGNGYNQKGDNVSLRFATKEMLMMDRILSIDKNGGIWGLGLIHAEKDLRPDHWYFTCHFMDDNVLAGSLMAEGCVQLLQFLILYLGLQTKTEDARFQPIKNLPNVVRCRGQTIPKDKLISYKLEVTEIGLEPRPYAKANVDIIMDGKVVVDFTDVGVELVEKNKGDIVRTAPQQEVKKVDRKLDFDDQDILDFATGSLVNCFGPEYEIFNNRITQRNPNGELQLISRVPIFKGEKLNFKQKSSIISEYDVPADIWFYNDNPSPVMPYSVIMEIALQPCGFLGAVMGSCLLFPDMDLCFRNLDGEGTLIKNLDFRGKVIVAKINLLSSSAIANTIIQKYDFELSCDNEIFYQGKTTFGYFTVKAFEKQLGLDKGKLTGPWFIENKINENDLIKIDLTSAESRLQFYQSKSEKPFLRLGVNQVDFIERVTINQNGGKYQKGYVYAEKTINPEDWFFTYHFYKDPVMPGSLGVEAIMQSLRVYAIKMGLADEFKSPHFTTALTKVAWKYSGQIVPPNKQMTLEVHIKEITRSSDQLIIFADASLWKDKLRIYELKEVSIAIAES